MKKLEDFEGLVLSHCDRISMDSCFPLFSLEFTAYRQRFMEGRILFFRDVVGLKLLLEQDINHMTLFLLKSQGNAIKVYSTF